MAELSGGKGGPVGQFEGLLIETNSVGIGVERQRVIAGGDGIGKDWSDLYGNLRRRVPDSIYHAGCAVSSVKMVDGETALLQLEDGRDFIFDLVIFADGYRSMGR